MADREGLRKRTGARVVTRAAQPMGEAKDSAIKAIESKTSSLEARVIALEESMASILATKGL